MITAKQAAQYCKAIYNPITPNTFSKIVSVVPLQAGIADIDGVRVVAFPGSQTRIDWLRDLNAQPFDHPELGMIHAGMWEGMDDFFAAIKDDLVGELVFVGHSLGCARAAYLAGLCSVAGIPVSKLFLFAPPRCSFDVLPMMLSGLVEAYRNGVDPVPMVPFFLPPLEDWHPIGSYTQIFVTPQNPIDIFAWHSIDLYCQGV